MPVVPVTGGSMRMHPTRIWMHNEPMAQIRSQEKLYVLS